MLWYFPEFQMYYQKYPKSRRKFLDELLFQAITDWPINAHSGQKRPDNIDEIL